MGRQAVGRRSAVRQAARRAACGNSEPERPCALFRKLFIPLRTFLSYTDRVKSYGPFVAARLLRPGRVSTWLGVDRVTGTPVLLYAARHDDLGEEETWALPIPDSPALLPFLEVGALAGDVFAVVALPLAAERASVAPLVARAGLAALAELHARGLAHGGVTPAQFWAVGEEVRLAGARLPWGRLGEGFDAPEGGPSASADLFALGRTLQTLGGLPSALAHLLDPDPAKRGTAGEALGRLDQPAEPTPAPRSALPVDSIGVKVLPGVGEAGASPPDARSEAHEGAPAAPGVIVVEAGDGEMPLFDDTFDEPPALRPGEVETAPATSGAPFPEGPPRPARPDHETGVTASPSVRSHTLRIGWEEDHSWRVVKSAPVPAAAPRRRALARPSAPLLAGGALALLALVALALSLWPRGRADVCCTVQFQVRGAANVQGKLHVVEAPAKSGLTRGQLLSRVPGEVRFPNAPGEYTLRLVAGGYQPQTLRLRVPAPGPVVLQVGR